MSSGAALPTRVENRYQHGYAVVDVETSGLSPQYHRVLQIAVVQLDAGGRIEREWTTLLDPECDPGPVHIHGLTRERLAGSPNFLAIAPTLHELVTDRVLVAHNARFDWQFLVAESARVSRALPVRQRLCTVALSRRLDIPVANMSLASVAGYWGVPQTRAHEAADDAGVVVEILRHSLMAAHQLDALLPIATCDSATVRRGTPPAAARTACPWRYPGRWSSTTPLTQGMKVVFTGQTARPRELLIAEAAAAGLDVMNSVSSRTSLLIRNTGTDDTRKAQAAAEHATPVVDERTWVELLTEVRPGQARGSEPRARTTLGATTTALPTAAPAGPLRGKRVLVIGGAHDDAAALRARVVELGGQAAAKLTASVTHVAELGAAERDPRHAKTTQLPRLDSSTLHPIATPSKPDAVQPTSNQPLREPVVLGRGAVTNLPNDLDDWSLAISWRDRVDQPVAVDVVAFVVDTDEQVRADEDFCFYNQPTHPSGAVELDLDTESEALAVVRPSRLPADRQRIVFAAALENGRAFGDLGPMELALRTPDGELVARSTLDAATTEQSMLLATLYVRAGTRRLRAVGQGYDAGLAHLAVLHGVDVED